jgi:hypothetical protein
VQSTGNLAVRDSVGCQLAHRVVVCPSLAAAHVLARLFAGGDGTDASGAALRFRRCGRWIGKGELPQVCVVAVEHPFHRFPQIVQQMPSVSHLDGAGSTVCRPTGVLGGPIARDDFDPRMLTEPGGQRVSGTIGQEIDRAALLQVNQDRAISMAAPQGEIINPQHA